jgi:hypothetical protein
MIESLFYLLVLVSAGIAALGIAYKKGAITAFGGLLLIMCGLLISSTAATAGIEKDYGTFVRFIDDVNYNIDFNIGYLNAGNDSTLYVLSNVFLYGGLALILASFVILVASYRETKRRRG